MGLSENEGTLFRGPIIRILLFRVLYSGPLFSETPKYPSLEFRNRDPKKNASLQDSSITCCPRLTQSPVGCGSGSRFPVTINPMTSQQIVRVSEQCILRAEPESHMKSLVKPPEALGFRMLHYRHVWASAEPSPCLLACLPTSLRTYPRAYSYLVHIACMHACMQACIACLHELMILYVYAHTSVRNACVYEAYTPMLLSYHMYSYHFHMYRNLPKTILQTHATFSCQHPCIPTIPRQGSGFKTRFRV